jgi:fructokinase
MIESNVNKRKVYALGETVLDLVSDGGLTMKAVPGGSVLNASVSLGRMGIDINLISEFGADKAGDMIDGFLRSNGVQTSYIVRHTDHKTSLALAFLDSAKNATYSFYLDSPDDLAAASIPRIGIKDILLFGSFYSVKADRREFVLKIMQKAVEAKAVIYYDLNIRKAHSGDMGTLMPSFLNNMAASTIVKGSDEDFNNLFGLTDPTAIYEKVRPYCKILIITNGAKPAIVFTPFHNKTYKVPFVTPVSTIGAGDNFNAGFVYGLATSGIDANTIAGIPISELDRLVGCGLAFATKTCLSPENYIEGNFETDFWKRYI